MHHGPCATVYTVWYDFINFCLVVNLTMKYRSCPKKSEYLCLPYPNTACRGTMATTPECEYVLMVRCSEEYPDPLCCEHGGWPNLHVRSELLFLFPFFSQNVIGRIVSG